MKEDGQDDMPTTEISVKKKAEEAQEGAEENEGDDDGGKSHGKYSKRKIASNAWRYEESEKDPNLEGLFLAHHQHQPRS